METPRQLSRLLLGLVLLSLPGLALTVTDRMLTETGRAPSTDEAYRQERVALERQMKLVSPPTQPRHLPNLERAAELLNNLPILWSHSGVTDEQRESFLREVFVQIEIDGKQITAIEPKPTYIPLFAAMLLN